MNYENLKIPKHLGIILDGNGRWAKAQGKSRSYGHKKGFENLKKLCRYIFDKNIEILSVFAFSTENFNRPKEEVNYLLYELFLKCFKEIEDELKEKQVKIIFSGMRNSLDKRLVKEINSIEDRTSKNNKYILNICLNYGGRSEIVDACKKISEKIMKHQMKTEDINEEIFSKHLYNDIPSIDFLIRTSGEQRISNFMLYQLAYAEFYFTQTYFPAFTPQEFDKAIVEYNKRDRRFGKIIEE